MSNSYVNNLKHVNLFKKGKWLNGVKNKRAKWKFIRSYWKKR